MTLVSSPRSGLGLDESPERHVPNSTSSWGGLKGVKPPEAFGERSRDFSASQLHPRANWTLPTIL